jgi:hypothetical protein
MGFGVVVMVVLYDGPFHAGGNGWVAACPDVCGSAAMQAPHHLVPCMP